MDFIVGLSCTRTRYDSIWVILDRWTEVAHFILVKMTYSRATQVELYKSRIVCVHGVPKKIMFDRGSQFTSKFWEKLQESMVPSSILAQHTIHRRTVIEKGPTKYWKIS
jgi:hypothetical protein